MTGFSMRRRRTTALDGASCKIIVSGFAGIYNKIDPDLGGSNPTITVFTLKR